MLHENVFLFIFSYFQNELTDDKYVRSSRIYSLVNDQLQHWNAELERYKALTESVQVKSDFLVSFLLLRCNGCTCVLALPTLLFLIKKIKKQAERVHVMKWEKELNSKLESADTARHTVDNSDCRTEELELQLQKCTIEKNDLEIKMEEAVQDTG